MYPCWCTPVPCHPPPMSFKRPKNQLLPRTPKPASFPTFPGCPAVFWAAVYYLLRLTGTSSPIQIPTSWSTLYATSPTAEYPTSSPNPLRPFPPCHPTWRQRVWSPASWTSTSPDTFFLFFFPPFQDLSYQGGLCLAASKSVTSTSKMHAVPLLQKLWTPFLSLSCFLNAVVSLSSPCLSSLSVYYCLSSSSLFASPIAPPVTVDRPP